MAQKRRAGAWEFGKARRRGTASERREIPDSEWIHWNHSDEWNIKSHTNELQYSLSHTQTHTHTAKTEFSQTGWKYGVKHTYQLLQSEKLVAALMSNTCSGPLGTCKPIWVKVHWFANGMNPPMTAEPVWQTSMPALVKKQSSFFLTAFVCVRMLWKLHVSIATRLILGQVVFFLFFGEARIGRLRGKWHHFLCLHIPDLVNHWIPEWH